MKFIKNIDEATFNDYDSIKRFAILTIPKESSSQLTIIRNVYEKLPRNFVKCFVLIDPKSKPSLSIYNRNPAGNSELEGTYTSLSDEDTVYKNLFGPSSIQDMIDAKLLSDLLSPLKMTFIIFHDDKDDYSLKLLEIIQQEFSTGILKEYRSYCNIYKLVLSRFNRETKLVFQRNVEELLPIVLASTNDHRVIFKC